MGRMCDLSSLLPGAVELSQSQVAGAGLGRGSQTHRDQHYHQQVSKYHSPYIMLAFFKREQKLKLWNTLQAVWELTMSDFGFTARISPGKSLEKVLVLNTQTVHRECLKPSLGDHWLCPRLVRVFQILTNCRKALRLSFGLRPSGQSEYPRDLHRMSFFLYYPHY